MLHSPTRPFSSSSNRKSDEASVLLSSSPSPRLTSVARKYNQQELQSEERSTSPFSKYSATSLDPRTLSFFVYDAIKKRSAKQLRLALVPFAPVIIKDNKKDEIVTASATITDVASSQAESTLQIGRTSTMKFLEMPTFPNATSSSSSFVFSPSTSSGNPISKNTNNNNSSVEDDEPSTHENENGDSQHVRSLPHDAVGRSPLFRACESGQFELVLILLEFYERKYNEFGKFGPPSAVPRTKNNTPSASNSLAVSRRGSTFLGTSQNNSEATSFSNPLPPATFLVSLMAASKFLTSVRQSSHNNTNNNNVMAAAARSTNTAKSLQNVEPSHAKESQLNEAFLAACTFGNLDLVLLLLHHGANPNGPSIRDDDDDDEGDGKNTCRDDKSIIIRGDHFGYRPIHGVAQHGYVKAITLMIRKGLKTVNVVDNNGFSPFAHACAEGQEKAALLLKMNGADINSQDKSGFSVLHTAVLRNQKQIVKMLLDESKIQVNTVARNNNSGGTTPLIDAIRLGYKRIVRILLESPKCDPCFSPTSSSTSPLTFAVLCGKSKSVRRLVERMQQDFEDNYEKWNQNRKEHMKTVHFHERIHVNKKNDEGDDDDEQENPDENDATSISSFYSSCHCSSESHNLIFDEERESDHVSSINKQDEQGETVLFTAVRLGYNKIIRRLCRGGTASERNNNNNSNIKTKEPQENTFDDVTKPKFHFANVSIRNSVDMNPIDLAKHRALDDLFKFKMIRFMERKIRIKPKKEGQSGDDDDDDDEDEKERNGELSMSDSMFIREWNEKQRQELLRKMKQDEEAVLIAQKHEADERKRKQEEEEAKQKQRRLQEEEEEAKKLKQSSRKPLTLKATKRSAEALLARMEAEDAKKKEEDERTKKLEDEKKKLQEEAEDKKKKEEEANAFVDLDEEEEEDASSDDDSVKEQNSDDDY